MVSQEQLLQVYQEQRMKAERDNFAYAEDRYKTGVKLGMELGMELGMAEAKAEAKAQAKAECVLNVLAVRGLVIGDEARARILGCRDFAQLERWLIRAVNAESVGEVLTEL